MIKQLQRRFIGVSMLAATLMMILLLGTVNGLAHYGMIRGLDYTLQTLVKRESVPKEDLLDKHIPPDSGRFARRNFSVTFDEANRVKRVDMTNDMGITEEEATAFAGDALTDGAERGFTGEYRYRIHALDTGTKVFLLDYSLERDMVNNFFFISVGVLAGALFLVFGLLKLMMKPAIRPVVESYEKQKRFITDAGHELKTPLAIISADAEVLELETGQSEWAKSIHTQVNRLKTLTEELVALSRMDEDTPHFTVSVLSLSDLVSDVVAGFEPAFAVKNRHLVTDIEERMMVSGDHDSLEKLVSILLDNALKYADGPGAVSVCLKPMGKRARLTVSNPAMELEPGRHDEFFDRFYRADPSRNRETGGYGIGLAIARSAVERHKGSIHADSADGFFTVTVEL